MTGQADRLAARTVTGVVAGMVVAVTAATVVGFWLSYSGLHDFATRAGLTGPEGWAWPASVDLFIAAGEAGVTISALRRRRDPLAWAYLAAGFAASVTGNVLHVDTGHLAWARYAVAAVPPMAAMLALAALLRHVYQLAVDRHEARSRTGQPTADRPATKAATDRPAKRTRPPAKPASGRRSQADIEAEALAAMAAHPQMSGAELGRVLGVSDRTGRRLADRLGGRVNGQQST